MIKIIDQMNQNIEDKTSIIDLDEIGSISVSWEKELPPGAYELVDINNYIQQTFFIILFLILILNINST